MQNIRKRRRFFFAVEGESEQSFVKWLQILSDEEELGIHLQVFVLDGGGFKSMLEKAVREREKSRRTRGIYRGCFLLVDGDRENEGDWPISRFKEQAKGERFVAFIQRPNFEGVLVRLRPGFEAKNPGKKEAEGLLKRHWPNYEKPENAEALRKRFTLADLRRAARRDDELGSLLKHLGFSSD